ncbi:hypothetical protein M9H77_03044 [Catharanthus roseus]|uniref:Uncharacterized protein n=1 Tax=Catharanthus roseus TaxID=4058 RepID=A0ACC0CA61_CATRO|nr:hypothetical protein M9H77_03044 [Catharanthus roseus]
MHNNQWTYDNFSLYAISFEHNSYDCYEGNRLGNYYKDRSYERAPRNEIRNGGNYVKMDDRFHKRRNDYERYCDSYNYGRRRMGLKPIKTWSLMKLELRIRCGDENYEGLGQGQSTVKFMESSMDEESTKVKGLSQVKLKKVLKHML